MFPSIVESSIPVTVTVWAVFQFDDVNNKDAGETEPSVESELLSAIETFAVGWLFKFTVKVAVPPASVVEPVMALMTNPADVIVVPPELLSVPESPPEVPEDSSIVFESSPSSLVLN